MPVLAATARELPVSITCRSSVSPLPRLVTTPRGDALPGTSPQQLGISPSALNPASGQIVDKVATTYVTNSEVEVLQSTAAAVNDTWSIPGQVIATEGKGTQMLSSQSGAFDAIGGGR